jgi:hypothetical protein
MVLPYMVFPIIGALALARAVAHISYSRLSEHRSAVLLSRLWRPAMEAGYGGRLWRPAMEAGYEGLLWRPALALQFTRLIHISRLALVPSFFWMCLV